MLLVAIAPLELVTAGLWIRKTLQGFAQHQCNQTIVTAFTLYTKLAAKPDAARRVLPRRVAERHIVNLDLRTWLFLRARRGMIAENQCEKTRERERSRQEENAILHHDLLVA